MKHLILGVSMVLDAAIIYYVARACGLQLNPYYVVGSMAAIYAFADYFFFTRRG